MQAVAQSCSMECLSQDDLRFRVLLPNSRHHQRTSVLGNYISHSTTPSCAPISRRGASDNSRGIERCSKQKRPGLSTQPFKTLIHQCSAAKASARLRFLLLEHRLADLLLDCALEVQRLRRQV